MKELKTVAKIENIEKVTSFVNEQLAFYKCPRKTQNQIDIVIDEIFGNIAHYAYNPGEGPVTVRVEIAENPLSVILTFLDNGIRYNPLEKSDPDISLSAEDREFGGLGIYMVKKTMDEIVYKYKDRQNILSVKKKIAE